MSQTEKYKLFAFALMIKRSRGNGMYYFHETLNSLRVRLGLGIAYNTFVRYWKILDEADCITQQGEHRQLITYPLIAERLGIDLNGKYINQLLRQKNISKMSLTEASDWVCKILICYYLRSQEFKLKRTKDLINIAHLFLAGGTRKSDKATIAGIKKLAKEASKNGMDTYTYAKSLLAKKDDVYIKTGSYHLSNILGISQRTVNRLLNQMKDEGMIKREVIKIKHDLPVCDASFDYLKEQLHGQLFFVTKHGFLQVLGSRITLPANDALFFPKEKPIIRFGVRTGIKTIKYECAA